MDKRLENILVEKYPEIFMEYGGNPKDTCMAWGCACGSGWFGLIDDVCRIIKFNVYDVRTRYPELSGFNVYATQIKEKWGRLVIYTHTTLGNPNIIDSSWKLVEPYQDRIAGAISMAEVYSGRVCENCGNYGKIRGGTWLSCSCNLCDGFAQGNCRDDLKIRADLSVERIIQFIEEEKRENAEMF